MEKLTCKCILCHKEYEMPVFKKDNNKYKEGELIQKCFPYLNEGYRELLISGTCPICWTKIFPSEDE